MTSSDLLAIARGDQPADLVLRGGRLVNVFTGDIEAADIAIHGAAIAGVGPGYSGRDEVDLAGAYVVPGLIDAHVHIESSMVTPSQFASAVVPRGVTTVVTDPHEIANVLGVPGVRFMLEDASGSPLTMLVNAPSCVPATAMETSGATLEAEDLVSLLDDPHVIGLAEVMNFPGVIHGDPGVQAKLDAFRGRVIDGHAPGVTGQALNAYVAAGPGSDHESTTIAEAEEKLRRGMYVFIREATNAHNLRDLVPLVNAANERRICLCTDDRQPADLLREGSIDYLVRLCIQLGVDPLVALRMATLNTAERFGLHDRGAIAPGRVADLVVLEDFESFAVRDVYKSGRLVATEGRLIATQSPAAVSGSEPVPGPGAPAAHITGTVTGHATGTAQATGTGNAHAPGTGIGHASGTVHVTGTVHIDWASVDLRIPAAGDQVRVIEAIEGQLVTRAAVVSPRTELASDGTAYAVADPARDLLKMAVIERHGRTGNVGLGFVRGLGLKRGAIASTVAHDHHNLVVIGVDDESMLTAARAVAATGGGQSAALGADVLAELPLPVAGLMSDRPIDEVARQMDALIAAARELGSAVHDPFMAMSFLALEVIPSLKLTDVGLVDVDRFEVVPLFL